ncbi:MAG: hypothetical protein IKF78_13725, partial [Atopobiaceae bacterium]|nr:hypothetical protein [Atopobiaceae bacterium]
QVATHEVSERSERGAACGPRRGRGGVSPGLVAHALPLGCKRRLKKWASEASVEPHAGRVASAGG